jgi:hypothetical protein
LRQCRDGLTGGIYEEPRRFGLRWHDIRTKFHKVWLRKSSTIDYLKNLRGCSVDTTDRRELRLSDGLMWHDIHAYLHKNWFRHLIVGEDLNVDTHAPTNVHAHNKIIRKPTFFFFFKIGKTGLKRHNNLTSFVQKKCILQRNPAAIKTSRN